MSVICGIFNRNGNPVDKKIVDDMFKAMTYWESDEHDFWIDGPRVFGHAMFWNTPESKYEHLPLQKDVYVLTMDARIDNRDELANELQLPNCPMSEIGDSEFILAAYQKWGEECPKYLLGDFSFVIWDDKKQQLFCSRDYIGIKSFYYYLDDEKFIFSNEIKVLLSYVEIEYILNEDAIAYYLKYDFLAEQDTTFYSNIHKLLPATTMTIKSNEKKVYTYWKAEECSKIRYKSLDEYIYHARELLEKAVYTRIRSIYPIATHLSGGLDSSSIATLASRKLAENGHTLTGFNWIPILDNDISQNYFEWAHSHKIALLENIEHKAIKLSENDVWDIYKTLDITLGNAISFWYEYPIQKYARKKNIRVILSGTGGDQFISHKGRRDTTVFSWREEVYGILYSKDLKIRDRIVKIIKSIIRSIVPHWIFCIYNKRYCSFKVPKYIKPSMSKLIKSLRSRNELTNSINMRNSMLNELCNGSLQSRIDAWSTLGRLNQVEYRYPLLDRRLVEFALSIPEEIFNKNGKERFLFRRIIEELLPQEIVWFNTKYEPKRVEEYMKISKKAQSEWKKLYISRHENPYINVDTLFNEIDRQSQKNDISSADYDRITTVTSVILLLEFFNKGK
ncbi:MAG: hypothetical protein KAI79_14655 [Bacteroidales bacterium]|nr:hypothetical protein [Bacteroidales bacterium]